jgi:hypothetical protein
MRLSRLVHAVCGGPRDRSRASRCDRGTVEGGRAHFMGTRSDVATGTHVGSGGGDAEQQIRHSWQAASLPSAGSLPPSASCVHSASAIAPSGPAPMATAGNIANGDRTSCRISALDSISGNVKQDDSNNDVAASGCGEQIDDILDGLVSAMIGGFESAVWAMLRVWSVVEAAVGKWSAQPFVEEQK